MLIYLIIFLLFIISAFFESFGRKVPAALFLIFTCIILLIITALREGIGKDFYSYAEIYEDVNIHNNYSSEPGFVFLNYISFYLGGFKALLFLTALINLVAIIFILRRLGLNISIGLLTYYCLFYLNHNFNTIRHGLMATAIWVMFYFFLQRRKIKAYLYYIVAILFHQLAVLLLPIQFLNTKKRLGFLISILFLLVFSAIGSIMQNVFIIANVFVSQFSNKIDYYLNDYYGDEAAKYEFGMGFLLYLLIYFSVSKYERLFKNSNHIIVFNKVLFVGVSVMLVFFSVSIFVERVANVLLMSIIFIFASVNQIKIKSNYRVAILVTIFLIDFFYLYKILHITGINRQYQFIPYQFSF